MRLEGPGRHNRSRAVCISGGSGATRPVESEFFQFLLQGLPVNSVARPFGQLFFNQQLLQSVETGLADISQQGTAGGQTLRLFRKLPDKVDEILGCTALLQPEMNTLGGRIVPGIGEVGFNQTSDHGPVFVTLGLFGLHEIRKAQQFQN